MKNEGDSHECGVFKVYDSDWVLINKHDVKTWKPLEFLNK